MPLDELQGSYDLICANIVHDVLVEMAPDISRLLAPGGKVVLAGILREKQEENIIEVYRRLGVKLLQATHEDEVSLD